MRSLNFAVIGMLILVIASCSSVSIKNVPRQPFSTEALKLSSTQIEKIIIKSVLKHQWIITNKTEGKLIATYSTRGHIVKVAIDFDQSGFSISYVDSTNMNYDGNSIHRNYNRWVNIMRVGILRDVNTQAVLLN